jgi:hypothetical protein
VRKQITPRAGTQNVRDAEMKARSSVLREWKRGGYEASAGSPPVLQVEELQPMPSRFRLRSSTGFTFFNAPKKLTDSACARSTSQAPALG